MDDYIQPSASSILQTDLVSVADLCEKPPTERKWVLEQLIPEGKPVLLGGPPGAGKSLLAQQICMAVSLGVNLFGRKTNGRPTLYLTCEDDTAELHRRSVDIAKALGHPISAFINCFAMSLEGYSNTSLCTQKKEVTQFYKTLDQLMADFGFGLVVLDVVSDYWDGNEIIRQDVNDFVKGTIGSLAFRHQAAVMLLHHPSLQGKKSGDGQSGSTAWEGSVRSRLYLREDKNGVRELSLKKSNYSDRQSINLIWNEGALQLTDQVVCANNTGGQRLGKHATNVLELLEQHGGEVLYTTISKELGSGSTYDAVQALLNKGLVRRDEHLVFLND